jgi:hypothetical protein
MKKIQPKKIKKLKVFWLPSCPNFKIILFFWDIAPKLEIGIL